MLSMMVGNLGGSERFCSWLIPALRQPATPAVEVLSCSCMLGAKTLPPGNREGLRTADLLLEGASQHKQIDMIRSTRHQQLQCAVAGMMLLLLQPQVMTCCCSLPVIVLLMLLARASARQQC